MKTRGEGRGNGTGWKGTERNGTHLCDVGARVQVVRAPVDHLAVLQRLERNADVRVFAGPPEQLGDAGQHAFPDEQHE